MFKRRTLFIVGAGASAEVGFPVGTGLAKIIADKLTPQMHESFGPDNFNDRGLFEQMRRRHPSRVGELITAGFTISNGVRLANSIDDFLNIHSTDSSVMLLGKAAIIRAILEAERHSSLFVDQSNMHNKLDIGRIEKTWFVKLMRVLGSGGSPSSVEKIFDGVSFIVFNYDRCVEHFLCHALHALYGISRQDASAIVRKITIIHPYGKIAELEGGVPFGDDGFSHADYFLLADRIKTYTEQIAEEDELARIRGELERAACIVFLGFSYLEQNMALLRPRRRMKRKPIFGTALGLSDNDRDIVEDVIGSMFVETPVEELLPERHIELNIGLKCSDLFDHYARSLSAS